MTIDGVVAPDLVGDVWPTTEPGTDPVLYGHVSLEPRGAFEVRSVQTFKMVYTVGRYGIDDTGSIRVVFRFMGDWGDLQTADPSGYNYVSAYTNNSSRVSVSYSKTGHQRPWFRSLTCRLHGGYLKEGDTITIIFGDTSQGSPGMKMQTFCEAGFEFKVLADVCAVGHYVPLAESPHISIVPGKPHCWKAILPTLRRPGERFQLGIKAEDRWGNPTAVDSALLQLRPSVTIDGLPDTVRFDDQQRSLCLENLSVNEECCLRIDVLENNVQVAEAGPLLIKNGDLSVLDVSGHQANDFQVNNAFWTYLNELTAEYHEDQRFVVFPGYEWSGNTAVGGDRNVFYRNENRPIRRSSHALISDRSDIDTDASDANALFEALADEDCVVYAHVGGRYADIAYAHDPRLETAMEIHSAWGTFEWLLTDGFPLGHRSGVVCNSDGHKGRPGAYGGLTCFLTDDFSRDGIFECLRRRHHYGTTGCRLHLQVNAHFDQPAFVFERDPAVFSQAAGSSANTAMMGDIVRTTARSAELSVSVASPSPIERIEIRNGTETIETCRPFTPGELGNRIRVLWSGAEYRGRGRQTNWTGRARFENCTIRNLDRINAWNHERKLEQRGHDTVEWDAMTTGNFGGFDVSLDAGSDAYIDLTSNHGGIRKPLSEIGEQDILLDAGGLNRQIRVFRLPDHNPHRELDVTVPLQLKDTGDNPVWVCVTTEDGFQAWSSPIFIFRD